MDLVGVKFCGGCNPVIDRQGLMHAIEEILPSDVRLTTDESPEKWAVGIVLCGCPVACADRTTVGNMSGAWICVGGETIDLERSPKDEMAHSIVRKIESLRRRSL